MTTEAEIKAWIADYRRDFDQECQALMWQLASRFGTVVATPPSAISAWNTEKAAGRTKGGTPPPGAFVYFDIGVYGHVGFMVNSGRIFMGTTHVDEQWSDWNTGPQELEDYCAITGARYLGWSYQNGGNKVPFTPDAGTAGGDGTPIGRARKAVDDVVFLFGPSPSDGKTNIYVIAGGAGCPWDEYGVTDNFQASFESQYGSAVVLNADQMRKKKSAYTAKAPSGSGGLTAEQDELLRTAAQHPSYGPLP